MIVAQKTLRVLDLACVRQHKILFTALSFQLNAAEALLIEGPNGSGKSSLLRLLTGLVTPSAGEIFWQHQLIQEAGADYWNNLHFVGHANGIKLGLTVAENLRLTSHLSLSAISPDISPVLEALQLSTHKNTLARYLSAGQKRRLGLAKLILFPKSLWILDEPLTALDAATQTVFLSWLETHLQKGGMAIISSHHSIQLSHLTVKNLRLSASC